MFFRDEDYYRYTSVLGESAEKYGCRIHAYVLMTNHVHILATPNTEQAISKIFQSLGRKYVQVVNRKYERSGTLWESRYKASLVDSETYLLACYRYIELNPVRAGLFSSPSSYPYSSHHQNAYGRADPVVTPHMTYLALGSDSDGRRTAYRTLFDEAVPHSQIAEIRHAAKTSRVLGSDQFKSQIEALAGQPVGPRRPGRHRTTHSGTMV